LPLVHEVIKETNECYNSRIKGLGKEFVVVVQ
jgi:hypothetical protein